MNPKTRARTHLAFCGCGIALFLAAAATAYAQRVGLPASSAPAKSVHVYNSKRAATSVRIVDETWRDSSRSRDVPVRIYLPVRRENPGTTDGTGAAKNVARTLPVIIFSHGLWGSGKNYGYFGQHLASHGYIVIAPTHAGSDTADLRKSLQGTGGTRPLQRLRARRGEQQRGDDGDDGYETGQPSEEVGGRGLLMQRISDPDNLRNRPRDISFVIDEMARSKTLSGAVDLSRIGVAGHSFGAYTAMAVGGMTIDLAETHDMSFRDKRIRAVLPMSPEGAGVMGITTRSWDHFAAPVLFLTGTRDYGSGRRSASWRRTAFDSIRGCDNYLVVLTDATHMTFSGRAGGKEQPHHTEFIEALATAFFDAYLRDEPSAKLWLRELVTAPKQSDYAVEFKPARP